MGRSLFASLALVLLASGCGLPVKTTGYGRGSVLVLPPRDVVQNGVPHERGVGSGERLGHAVANQLRARDWEALMTDSEAFDHLTEPSDAEARAEGERVGADYALKLVLGEFRDAAPMSFRSDFVTLDRATLVDCQSGEVVWFLTKPVGLDKGNIGGYLGMVDKLGAQVAASIVKLATP